ncbi:MAG: arginine N-succinyltransferase [Planctomycetes bacterium]|nr:arginine N-succinyltransferase [Planctomycetota bacterium]
MLVIRPITLSDLDALLELAGLTGFGLTTLPHDRDLLRKRIKESERAFERMDEETPHGEAYLFVMEDLHSGRVVGTCGVASKVGGFEPFYAYRIETSTIESEMLKVKKEVRTLHLVAEHNGPSEIGSLFLHPEYRKGGSGWLLSLSRFLFMAEHPRHFDPVVIAEMRGVLDEHGGSAFWDALGRHFFEIDYPKADYLSMLNKRFIADLMPRHPIYITLLPPTAQAVIGQVHEQTRPALRMLEDEGFRFNQMVDIFEAGPVVSCRVDQVRTVRESIRAVVREITDDLPDAASAIVSTTDHRMRACKTAVTPIGGDGVKLTSNTALSLHVKVGDTVRYIPARDKTPRPGGS